MHELKIIKGPKFIEVNKDLNDTHGYCPCVPPHLWNEDTMCICKEFLDKQEPGNCNCGMYTKIKNKGK